LFLPPCIGVVWLSAVYRTGTHFRDTAIAPLGRIVAIEYSSLASLHGYPEAYSNLISSMYPDP
jgi:hypothetical protein